MEDNIIIKAITDCIYKLDYNIQIKDKNIKYGLISDSLGYPKTLTNEFYDFETSELIFLEISIQNNSNVFEITSILYVGESGDILAEMPIIKADNYCNLEKIINFISSLENQVLQTITAFRMPKPINLFNSIEKILESVYQEVTKFFTGIIYSGMGSYDKGNIDLLWAMFSLPEYEKGLAVNIPIKRTGYSLIVGVSIVDIKNRSEKLFEIPVEEISVNENNKDYQYILVKIEDFLKKSVLKILNDLVL